MSCYLAQADLELMVLLLWIPEYWGYGQAPPPLVNSLSIKNLVLHDLKLLQLLTRGLQWFLQEVWRNYFSDVFSLTQEVVGGPLSCSTLKDHACPTNRGWQPEHLLKIPDLYRGQHSHSLLWTILINFNSLSKTTLTGCLWWFHITPLFIFVCLLPRNSYFIHLLTSFDLYHDSIFRF